MSAQKWMLKWSVLSGVVALSLFPFSASAEDNCLRIDQIAPKIREAVEKNQALIYLRDAEGADKLSPGSQDYVLTMQKTSLWGMIGALPDERWEYVNGLFGKHWNRLPGKIEVEQIGCKTLIVREKFSSKTYETYYYDILSSGPDFLTTKLRKALRATPEIPEEWINFEDASHIRAFTFRQTAENELEVVDGRSLLHACTPQGTSVYLPVNIKNVIAWGKDAEFAKISRALKSLQDTRAKNETGGYACPRSASFGQKIPTYNEDGGSSGGVDMKGPKGGARV